LQKVRWLKFELLNRGYAATNALAAIDHILAGHAGELAIAVHKLSAAMTSDDQLLADSFDEQHILYALEVLKVAGSFIGTCVCWKASRGNGYFYELAYRGSLSKGKAVAGSL
jgi:hypothetical protein